MAILWLCVSALAQMADDERLSVFGSELSAPAQAPIPTSPKAKTLQDIQPAQISWMRRAVLEPFRAHLKGAAWDKQALGFMEKAIEAWDARDNMIRAALLPEGKAAIEAGCDDPALVWVWARFEIEHAGSNPEVLTALQKAIERFPQTTYPKAVAWMAVLECRAVINDSGAPHASRNAAQKLVDKVLPEWAIASLTDDSYKPNEDFLLVRDMVRYDLVKVTAEPLAAALEQAKLSNWARETLLGHCETELAWKARTGDWANKVTEAGWRGFAQYLQSAREHLKSGWELKPDRPEAAAKMIAIVMAGEGFEGDTLRTWFDRAVSAEFDYYPAYSAMSWALRPRWGGSHEEMLAFARACLATRRYDTDTPLYYYDVIHDIADDVEDWRAVYHQPRIASELITLSEALIHEPTRKDELRKRRQYLALHAFLTGKFDAATAATAEPLGELYPGVKKKLRTYGIDHRSFVSALEVMADPEAGRDFKQAEERFLNFNFDEAEPLYQSAAARLNAKNQPTSFIERLVKPPPFLIARRLAAIKFERELAGAKGEWVKLKPSLNTWQVMEGQWIVQPDGTLVARGTDTPGLILAPARPGEDFEVRGEFEVESPGSHDRDFSVVVAYNETTQRATIASVWQEGAGKMRAGIMVKWGLASQTARTRHEHTGKTQFLVQVWNGKVNFYLNGEPMQAGFEIEPEQPISRESLFGFGNQLFMKGNTTYVRNIEVRRLSSEPEPPVIMNKTVK